MNADETGEHEVERFLLEHQLFAQLQRALPVPAEKFLRLGHQAVVQPRLHAANLRVKGGSDEGGFAAQPFFNPAMAACISLKCRSGLPESVTWTIFPSKPIRKLTRLSIFLPGIRTP